MDNNEFLGTTSDPLTIPTKDETNIALLSHLIVLVSAFIGPAVIYYLKRKESDFIADHALESLNFQITLFSRSLASIY